MACRTLRSCCIRAGSNIAPAMDAGEQLLQVSPNYLGPVVLHRDLHGSHSRTQDLLVCSLAAACNGHGVRQLQSMFWHPKNCDVGLTLSQRRDIGTGL